MTVYLIHASGPIGDTRNPHGSAQHYIGWTSGPVEGRIEAHRHKKSRVAITAAFVDAGRRLILARTWKGERDLERRLKNYKCARRLCPICSGTNAMKRMR